MAPTIDRKVFIPAVLIAVGVGTYLSFWPEAAAHSAAQAMAFVTGSFGWLFTLTGGGFFVLALWLAFGRYGHVKLGDADDEPEFGEMTWAAMMFSAGIGIGLVSWAFVEPIHYLATPPFSIEVGSALAAEWAHMYGQFHWGFIPWALYAVPAVPVAYLLYVRKHPNLRISAACSPMLTGKHAHHWAPVIDTLVILGLLGGAATSLGLGVPLVSAFVSSVLGVADSLALRFGVLAVWTLMFGSSVYLGLRRGITLLSDLNIVLAMLTLLFVLVTGPTVLILSMSANSLGLLLDNFARMSFWLDPVAQSGFPEDWTLFYWAWWVSYAPMMGLFFGRISKGRTIRQLIVGVIGWGSLGCISFMAICGAYALDLELSGSLPVGDIIAAQGIPAAVAAIVGQMPYPDLMLVLYTVLSFVFLATTLDSAAYVLASISTKNLTGDQEPARANRLIWAFVLAFVAVGLLVVGGLKTVQSSTLITALPLIPVLALLALSLLRTLKRDFGAATAPMVYTLEHAVDPRESAERG